MGTYHPERTKADGSCIFVGNPGRNHKKLRLGLKEVCGRHYLQERTFLMNQWK